MRVVIRSRGLWVDKTVRDYPNRQLRLALGHVASRIGSVRVYFAVLNDPGGSNLGCRIVVPVPRAGRVVVTERHPDFYALVDRASRRAGNTVVRRLRRRRARRMRHGRKLLTVSAA